MNPDIELFNKLLPENAARVWKDVPGFEGRYVVSDDGYVGSLSRTFAGTGGSARKLKPRILKPRLVSSSRRPSGMAIRLYMGDEGSPVQMNVGRAVLLAFVGESEGRVALFKDQDFKNNRLSNMEWGTHSERASIGWESIRRRNFANALNDPKNAHLFTVESALEAFKDVPTKD